MSHRKIWAEDSSSWCEAEIILSSTGGKQRLSITGSVGSIRLSSETNHRYEVHKRSGGKAFVLESCGQVVDALAKWFPELVKPYLKWHLNDMHAECEHQEKLGWTWVTHPSEPCPECGYKLGSAWTYRELPTEVIQWATTVGVPA